MKDYTKELQAMLIDLTKELDAIGIHDPKNPQDWVAVPEENTTHETDTDLVADVVEAWDERQGLVATLETQYNNIMRALANIQAGTFGVCEIGREPIEADRLDANPTARTCKAHMNEEGTLS